MGKKRKMGMQQFYIQKITRMWASWAPEARAELDRQWPIMAVTLTQLAETCGYSMPINGEIPALTVRDHNALGPCTRIGCGVCGGPHYGAPTLPGRDELAREYQEHWGYERMTDPCEQAAVLALCLIKRCLATRDEAARTGEC